MPRTTRNSGGIGLWPLMAEKWQNLSTNKKRGGKVRDEALSDIPPSVPQPDSNPPPSVSEIQIQEETGLISNDEDHKNSREFNLQQEDNSAVSSTEPAHRNVGSDMSSYSPVPEITIFKSRPSARRRQDRRRKYEYSSSDSSTSTLLTRSTCPSRSSSSKRRRLLRQRAVNRPRLMPLRIPSWSSEPEHMPCSPTRPAAPSVLRNKRSTQIIQDEDLVHDAAAGMWSPSTMFDL